MLEAAECGCPLQMPPCWFAYLSFGYTYEGTSWQSVSEFFSIEIKVPNCCVEHSEWKD